MTTTKQATADQYRERLSEEGRITSDARTQYLRSLAKLSQSAREADELGALSRLEIARRAGVSITTARRWFNRA